MARILSAIVLGACCMGVLATAGCGGGGSSTTPPFTDPPSYDPYPYYDPYYDDPYVYDPYYRYPDAPPIAPRRPTNIFEDQLNALYKDWDEYVEELHVTLAAGINTIRCEDYLAASKNVTVTRAGRKKYVRLGSEYDTVSFITYGFTGRHGDETLMEVEVHGRGYFGHREENGLYIGIHQFGGRNYQWFGPFWSGDEWRVPLKWHYKRWYGSHAFVTLAVFDGDACEINELRIDVK